MVVPNYVTSRCAVRGPSDEVERFKAATFRTYDTGDRYLDFRVPIPMPACLVDSEASSLAEIGATMILLRADRGAPFADVYQHWHKRVREELGMIDADANDVCRAYLVAHPDVEAAGRARLQRILETGYSDWYPWCIENWGTKWNSFRLAETGTDPFEFRFETAWSFPEPVFAKLAEMFPALSFACVCYDEGSNFAGVGSFNPLPGEEPFAIVEASDELYERAHGEPKPVDEEEEAA